MNLIKLNATESTNSFLKDLSRKSTLDNFTVVWANEQYNGRGQMASSWISELGKNLTFSVLVRFEDLDLIHSFYVSKIVSISVFECVKTFLDCSLSIKWPNDIMAAGSKLAGILIENSVKKTKVAQSIVGIGLNVNQISFEDLPNATSFKKISKKEFQLESILNSFMKRLEKNVDLLRNMKLDEIDNIYFKSLYKMNQPSMFNDDEGNLFMGKIIGVSKLGKLQIELENGSVSEFDLKEVKFA